MGIYVLKDGKSQIVIEDTSPYKESEIDKYKQRFYDLKERGVILKNEFSDFTWICSGKDGSKVNLLFRLSMYPNVNVALKCLAIKIFEQGNTAHSIQGKFKILQDIIVLTNYFSYDKLEDFENYINDRCSNAQLIKISKIVPDFLCFYNLDDYADDYLDIAEGIICGPNNVRKIPDYKSILIFHNKINETILSAPKDISLLKYYPLFLWWKITGNIPLRPSEFLKIDNDSCYKEGDRYWIKLPRNKVKQTTVKSQIEICDTVEITKDIYDFIHEYKSLLKTEFKSPYLISWKAYNHFFPGTCYSRKINPEIMKISSLKYLLDDFYRTYIKNEKVISLKPGDSRHIAFCNLILQGYNPIAIARLGGHQKLISQIHYYDHLDTYAGSHIFTMADKLKTTGYCKNGNRKFDTIKRGKLLSTYSVAQIEQFLEIQKGFCTVKTKECEDFTDCEPDCWECLHHIINEEKYPEVKRELNLKSDKLDKVIKEQTSLLKSIFKNMFYDYSIEKSSFEGNSRLKSTAEQLQSTITQKIIIDTKLLDYLEEVKYNDRV